MHHRLRNGDGRRGGSLRDVLLGHYPLTWVRHPEYLWMTSMFLVLDALGLVAFTVIGCQVVQQMRLSITVVLLSGMITGCAGGVDRRAWHALTGPMV